MVTSTGVRASPSEHEFSPSRRRLCCLDLVLIALQYCIKVHNPGKWLTWNICTLWVEWYIYWHTYWVLIIDNIPTQHNCSRYTNKEKKVPGQHCELLQVLPGILENCCYRFSMWPWRPWIVNCYMSSLVLSHMVGGDKRSQVVRRQVLPFVIGDVLDNKGWLNFIARSFLSKFFTLLHWKSLSMGGLFTIYVDKVKKLFEVKAYCYSTTVI